ncbi:MAG: methionyl-tRNA formyltransferase [Thermodesulfobacteriota bacterium]|nr:methionyl-tRNA formyltransferase [Thermodesulfobacteriota bacterium]
MGTPDFAVPSLTALHKNDYNVSLVVSQPDRPKGRGRKVVSPPVKEAAQRFGYDVIQPISLKNKDFFDTLSGLKPDMFIVVAFGHILSKNILGIPLTGAINLHASLLPKYRGPAPIQWAIINQEKETGVTTMLMDEGMDTGDILLSSKEKITKLDTSASLHDRLAVLGADLLLKTLKSFEMNNLNPAAQDHADATYAPLLTKGDGRIDWKKNAEQIACFIRGVTPWPGAFTFQDDKRLKIFSAKPIFVEVNEAPGTVLKGFPDELRIATGKGALSVIEIQGASGKRLLIKDFLMGSQMPPGTVLH